MPFTPTTIPKNIIAAKSIKTASKQCAIRYVRPHIIKAPIINIANVINIAFIHFLILKILLVKFYFQSGSCHIRRNAYGFFDLTHKISLVAIGIRQMYQDYILGTSGVIPLQNFHALGDRKMVLGLTADMLVLHQSFKKYVLPVIGFNQPMVDILDFVRKFACVR